ncbi:Putative dehydratase/epimerase (Mannitol) [Leuconostoc citreum LBAE E16]|uniref:NAD-dependent epimerase/dehydratase family protein n=1 Tax=Leuconostoc citreum TaxID=33964 RepID=UPI0002465D77|nr:NAD(P)-dependent oxidoreductase [Leuconostoc citreum]CCF28547.1 Putative dehydratase/epimerase (Mannitol) [Leuconostoc citreum LBAE E16]
MLENLEINLIVKKELIQLVNKHKKLFDKFDNKTVVISGATGLIGGQMVLSFALYNQLYGKNINIIALIRNNEKAKNLFGKLYSSISFIEADVREITKIEHPIDIIFHTAAVTQSSFMIEYPVDTLDIMYQGTKQLLEIARQRRSQFVYISSMEAFGKTDPKKSIIKEEDIGYIDLSSIRSTYPEGKRVCELLTTAYAAQYNLKTQNVRLAQSFGPGSDRIDNRVFSYFANSALQNKDIVIKSSGKSMGNYVDIRDAITAILIVSQQGEVGQTYTAVNEDSTMSIAELAFLVSTRFSSKKSKVIIENNEIEKQKFAPDTTMKLSSNKLRTIGWQPDYTITNMLDDMISSWK